MDSKNLNEILDVLALRFGTTVAHLWDVLIRQVYVEAIQATLFVLMSVLVVSWCFRCVTRTAQSGTRYEGRPKDWDNWHPLNIVALVFGCLWLIVVLVEIPWMFNAFTYVFNPEYGALKLLGSALK